MGRRGPDAVPVAVFVLAAWIDKRVITRAARVDLKDVPGSAVEKRVENVFVVFPVAKGAVALLRKADDATGVRVEADHADEDLRGPYEDAHGRGRRRRDILARLDHRERGDWLGRAPRRLIEHAVEANVPGRCADTRRRHVRRRLCPSSIWTESGRQRDEQHACAQYEILWEAATEPRDTEAYLWVLCASVSPRLVGRVRGV